MAELPTLYNNLPVPKQEIYDSYNNIMFSSDTFVFNKMVKRIEIYNIIKDLPGDILEFGVFKGAGIALFLKLKAMYEPNSSMKVIGFDYFDPDMLFSKLDGLNNSNMNLVINRVNKTDLSLDSVDSKLSIYANNYTLIKGDAVVKSNEYDKNNPGARIKMLYMDLDVGEPTYHILRTLWNKVVKGGIIVFDEYAAHTWDESNGVDKFLKEIPGQYDFFDTKIQTPTAYLKKTVV
jgi:hypothetical protein